MQLPGPAALFPSSATLLARSCLTPRTSALASAPKATPKQARPLTSPTPPQPASPRSMRPHPESPRYVPPHQFCAAKGPLLSSNLVEP